jgi:hypothetical protein
MKARMANSRASSAAKRAAVAALCFGVLWTLPGCARYGYSTEVLACGDGKLDPDETCDAAIAAGEPGACPSQCENDDPCVRSVLTGLACQTRCLLVPIDSARDGDGCCQNGATGAEDSDCLRCGNSIVEPGESCDPPEDCPTLDSCVATAPCVAARLQGSARSCDARCILQAIDVCSDDGCCPANCDATDDADCSSQCGDGEVDEDAGETCEPVADRLQCAANCDDGDPCTADIELGSAQNCSLQCLNTPIASANPGDDCCPPGTNAASDSDCAAMCGNGVPESGEECDGQATCASDCTRMLHASLLHRYRFTGEGVTATDWLGDADGSIVGTSLDGSGDLTLAGMTSDQYVDLPNGLVSQLDDATFEAWVTWSNAAAADHERIFDFGTSGNGEDRQGGRDRGYFYLTPSLVADGRPHVSFSVDGEAIRSLDGPPGSFPVASITHVAVVFSGSQQAMWLYVDGRLVDMASPDGTLSQLVDNNNWLGRSQFINDAEFGGVLHEFRIYDQALSAEQLEKSFEAGPDPEDG